MSAPIPPWEPLSEPVLADRRVTYDRMRTEGPLAEPPRETWSLAPRQIPRPSCSAFR